MKKIVIANQKGGIGKTTTAMALASILNAEGKKALLIDADVQGNSSDTYKAQIEGAATLYDVILADEKDRVDINEAVQHTENGDIIASDPLLRRADDVLNGDFEGQYRLADAIQNLKGYDYVIIDTAPALNSILHNCLVTADTIVIPITTDRFGIQGIVNLDATISAVKKRENKSLFVAGLLLVKYNPRTILGREGSEAIEAMAERMGTKVFQTKIRETVNVREAQGARENLIDYAPNCTAAEDYRSFTAELLKEI